MPRFDIRDLFKGATVVHLKHDDACVDMMRDYLDDAVGELSIIRAVEWPDTRRRFRAMTADAGAAMPAADDIAREDWRSWSDALARQVDRASPSQVARYYFEYVDPDNTGEIGCPMGCGGNEEER